MIKFFLAIITLAFLSTSCTHYGPITATDNKIGTVKGQSCASNILYLIPLSDDATIFTAAKNAKLSTISTVDYMTFSSIIYNYQCTIVRGNL